MAIVDKGVMRRMSTAQIDIAVPVPLPEAAPQTARPSGGGAQAVVHSVASRVAILALNAFTGILTARTLQPAGRGQLAAMIIWPLFLASATTLGIPSSLIYHLRHRARDRSELFANGFAMSLALGILATISGFFFLPYWLHRYPEPVIHAAQLFLLTLPLCSTTLVGRAILEGSDEFSTSNAIQILTPLATLLALLAFWAVHHLNAFTAAIAYVASALPTFILMSARVRRVSNTRWRLSLDACKRLLHYGVRSYGIDILGTLALQVDQVLVISLLTPSAMGAYVVVLSLSRMLSVFQNAVVMVLFPKAAGQPPEKVLQLTERSTRISALITISCGALVCLTGPYLLALLYGSEYVAAAGALRILVLEAIISGAVFTLAQAFMALAKPGIVTILQGLGLALSIPLMLWLIPTMGVIGAATALLLSTVARFLFVYFGFPIFLRTQRPKLSPGKDDFLSIWNLVCQQLRPEFKP